MTFSISPADSSHALETLHFVISYARPYWRSYLLGILVVPLSTAAALAIPWLAGECVNLLKDGARARELLPGMILWILLVAVVRGATLLASRWWIIGASRNFEFDLRNHLFRHLQRLDQSFYAAARTGDIMSRMTSDVERARMVAGPIILYSASTLVMLAGALPLMMAISLPLTLLVMLPLSLLTWIVRVIGPRVHTEVFKAQQTLADLSSLVQEDFSGMRVVKAFAREEEEKKRFAAVNQRYLEQNLRAARISAWMQPAVGAVGDVALISLLLVGGALILGKQLLLGDFIKFAGYQLQLIWPMISIGWVVNQYHRAGVSVARLSELLGVEPRVREPDAPLLPPSGRIEGSISIRGLTFAYNGSPVLRDIWIEAPRGSTVAVIGRTGSGKSTLINLIPRVLPPPDGRIYIDGVDVNALPLGLLRRSIGLVPQESFLFSRTVNENLAFGLGEADPEEIFGAARLSRLDKDIDQFPRRYAEMVGERGVTLSGGQRQRAAIARALLVKPQILILDDALSAVDTQTQEEIVRNLKAAANGLTTLVVSHRVSTILHADRIYVLEDGEVVEEGTHAELLARGGVYADIYRLQLLSDELESL
jgi:ATP-binding cassette subfamily B multidrug efflux pump